MNILVVGNGFDLAHKLPTNYWDCLNFLKCVELAMNYKKPWQDFKNYHGNQLTKIHLNLQGFIEKLFFNEENASGVNLKILKESVNGNFWLKHFLRCQKLYAERNHNWIDFEHEISEVIKRIDNSIVKNGDAVSRHLEFEDDYKEASKFCDEFLPFSMKPAFHVEDLEKMIDKLYYELERFTTSIEIYLKLCVENCNCELQLTDIMDIGKIDKVLSFNYTDTFYRYAPDAEACFIHGKIRSAEELVNFNSPLVVGMNEYLSQEEQSHNHFLMFRKFYQRILKETDYNYTQWHAQAQMGNNSSAMNLYIFGHSLDITDKDILKEIITDPGVNTTIFYRNESQHSKEINNLIRIIGSHELNKCTRGYNKSIFFKKQASQ